MPTNRRRRLQPHRSPISPVIYEFLKTGERGPCAPDDDIVEVFTTCHSLYRGNRRDVWEQHGSDVLREWIVGYPGARPWAWWQFDAREPRQVVEDRSHLVTYEAREWWWRAHLGVRFHGNCRRPGEHLIVVEAEAAYLRRLGLLVPGEAVRLRRDDFEPEEIDDLVFATWLLSPNERAASNGTHSSTERRTHAAPEAESHD